MTFLKCCINVSLYTPTTCGHLQTVACLLCTTLLHTDLILSRKPHKIFDSPWPRTPLILELYPHQMQILFIVWVDVNTIYINNRILKFCLIWWGSLSGPKHVGNLKEVPENIKDFSFFLKLRYLWSILWKDNPWKQLIENQQTLI